MKYKTNLLILGAGIGGYETFRSLAKLLKRYCLPQKILLLDQHNYFTFTPMHHEVATGSIEPVHCTLPLREIVAATPHTFLKASVKKIHPKEKTVETSEGTISYDFCVVALGSEVNAYGAPGAQEYAHHVRTLSAAMALHREIINRLEEKKDTLSLTIVGGGPTGVEMAGQLADFACGDVKKLYPGKRIWITLLEGNEDVLSRLPERARRLAKKELEKNGVEIHLSCKVKAAHPDGVVVDNGKKIPSDIIIWTAGFHNIALDILESEYCEQGRIPVTEHMNHTKAETLYAVGDIALAHNPGSKTPHPQLGEAAHRQGEYVARHIAASLRKKRLPKFVFRSLGTLMPIGDWYGIAIIGPFIFGGRFAWWLRRTVYVLFMPGIIRKLRIVIDWTLHTFGTRYMVDVEKDK